MKFVRFLERTGRVSTPGDLYDNLRILDEYIEQLRGDGYSDKTITPYRSGCANLLVWLHLSRIRLRDLTPDLLGQFQERQFICSIPGVFLGQRTHSPGLASVAGVRGFLKHLVEIGRIEPLEQAPVIDDDLIEGVEEFEIVARFRDYSDSPIVLTVELESDDVAEEEIVDEEVDEDNFFPGKMALLARSVLKIPEYLASATIGGGIDELATDDYDKLLLDEDDNRRYTSVRFETIRHWYW